MTLVNNGVIEINIYYKLSLATLYKYLPQKVSILLHIVLRYYLKLNDYSIEKARRDYNNTCFSSRVSNKDALTGTTPFWMTFLTNHISLRCLYNCFLRIYYVPVSFRRSRRHLKTLSLK